jgi:phosphomannomutase
MHAVGAAFAGRALEKFGLRAWTTVRFVEAQERPDQRPDPAFPTVAFPNPEEGEGALALAIEEANTCGATLIFANKPDEDRLVVAKRRRDGDGECGRWRLFTGKIIRNEDLNGTVYIESFLNHFCFYMSFK